MAEFENEFSRSHARCVSPRHDREVVNKCKCRLMTTAVKVKRRRKVASAATQPLTTSEQYYVIIFQKPPRLKAKLAFSDLSALETVFKKLLSNAKNSSCGAKSQKKKARFQM